jgi:hypothetical protein
MRRTVIAAAIALLATAACTPSQPTEPQRFLSPSTTAVTAALCHSINGRADGHCNPGLASHHPEVAADAPRYLHTLCQPDGVKPRWIAKRRPPTTYTNRIEQRELAAYGITSTVQDTELDHIIPLALDGDPGYALGANGLPLNLYPQPWEGMTGAKVKDREENSLRSKVCSGALTLQQAQGTIIADWVH